MNKRMEISLAELKRGHEDYEKLVDAIREIIEDDRWGEDAEEKAYAIAEHYEKLRESILEHMNYEHEQLRKEFYEELGKETDDDKETKILH